VPNNTPLVKEILTQIHTAIKTIRFRFEPVESVDYFLDTPEGQEKLDSLCMLFIAIGESLKNIDKLTDRQLLQKYDSVDWKAIKGMRMYSHITTSISMQKRSIMFVKRSWMM
jgi:uncharacterized protein with HEPN domain